MSESIFQTHFNAKRWRTLIEEIERLMAERACHPSRCVVLVPYAQLMAIARQAWVQRASPQPSAFLPRIETTENWARGLWASRGGYRPSPQDLHQDAARDLLTAASWLNDAGLAGQSEVLAPRLTEAAYCLARRVASIPPDQRSQWRQHLSAELTDAQVVAALKYEAAVAQLALAWAGSSGYLTDILFQAQPDLLVVLGGWQADPLAQALQNHLGPKAVTLDLAGPPQPRGKIDLHGAADREDEAQRAAACVLHRLQQGLEPVGLIAQDRALTRRIAALLASRQVAVRDETGWTLSTTRAAASLMALLRAASTAATCDEVMAWVKQLPRIDADAVLDAEAQLRRAGLRRWSDIGGAQDKAWALACSVNGWLAQLRTARDLGRWLQDLRAVLRQCGFWEQLVGDVAGQALLDALHLHDEEPPDWAQSSQPWSAHTFVKWVGQCLEAATFSPVHPAAAQVVLLPMAQLLGRSLAALVLPGADEVQMPAWPQPPGPWTARQRQLLGLPCGQDLADSARRAWEQVLQHEQVDVLWRQGEGGERRMAAPWVQQLMLAGLESCGPDPRVLRVLDAAPVQAAQAFGGLMAVDRLSASAYDDLRTCPYRFFVLRQLNLSPVEEIDAEIDRRDFGIWLHATLFLFHESLRSQAASETVDRARLFDQAAQQARVQSGLSGADFLPYEASVPALREGYLQWLATHERSGHRLEQAEQWLERDLGWVKLVGKIDRIDRNSEGQALLIDYKSESVDKTRERIKRPDEDTQLAFYAALLGQEAVKAAYLNVGERGQTKDYAQDDVEIWREQVIAGARADLSRLAGGEPLRALGNGRSCDHCQARGLCRRDFVQEAP